MRGLQERGIIRRNKMLHAAIALFLEHGYDKDDDGPDRPAGGDVARLLFCRL